MSSEWTLVKNILLITYVAKTKGKELTRRQLCTYVYLLDKVNSMNLLSLIDIYPDGIDLPDINILIDMLRAANLIKVIHSYVNITDKGAKKVEEILANPDDNLSRLNYRMASLLMSEDYELIMDLALYYSHPDKSSLNENIDRLLRQLKELVSKFYPERKPVFKGKIINK